MTQNNKTGTYEVPGAEPGTFWPPQDTTGWELIPGPDACRCGTSACRSGWEWRPVAATTAAMRDGSIPRPLAARDRAEHEAEAGS
jgi:hypothetical protein